MSPWQAFLFTPVGLVFVALYGAMIGSFLNVVAHRLPRGDSPLLPRSRCPRCLVPIRPWTNVPLLGWLMLRGRCRDCGGKISPRYPLVEAGTMALFVASFMAFDTFWWALCAALFCTWALLLALLDLDSRWLPDSLTLPMIVVGLLVQPWLAWTDMASAFAGVVVGAGLAVVASTLWRFWRHEDGLGYGDAKMMAALGACLGWWGTFFVLLVASSAAVVIGGLWMIRSRFKGTSTAQASVPFGAYLALGAVLYVLVWLPADGR